MKFDFAAIDAPIEKLWPVSVNVPQDRGKVQVQEFMVRFVLKDELELLELAGSAEGARDTFRQVITGIEVGEEIVTEPAFIAKVLSKPYVRFALQTAYREFSLGIGEVVTGN